MDASSSRDGDAARAHTAVSHSSIRPSSPLPSQPYSQPHSHSQAPRYAWPSYPPSFVDPPHAPQMPVPSSALPGEPPPLPPPQLSQQQKQQLQQRQPQLSSRSFTSPMPVPSGITATAAMQLGVSTGVQKNDFRASVNVTSSRPPQFSRPTAAAQSFEASASSPPFSTPLLSKPEPFPYSKTLPFPLTRPTPLTAPTASQSNDSHTFDHSVRASAIPTHPAPLSAPPLKQPTQHQQSPSPAPRLPHPSEPNQEFEHLYDVAKLLASGCSIICGKVYNDKGHNICGVLNQHDKPCKRIGKCPFHGAHRPVSQRNSINGTVDPDGTVHKPTTATHPASQPSATLTDANNNRSSEGSDTTTNNGIEVKVPAKMQFKHGWTKEEHYLFLRGLAENGRGSWKQIASVVTTRTPTQVQSHAQKYFQRQKQINKNKRSIHDLTLDSPEMIEVSKKIRLSNARFAMHSLPFTDNLNIPALRADSNAFKPPMPLGTLQAPLSHSATGMHDGRVAGNLSDNGLARSFGTAMTGSTTLSSPSTGMHLPHHGMRNSLHSRSLLDSGATANPHPHFLAPEHPTSFGSIHGRRPADLARPAASSRNDGVATNIPGRDAILSAIRPALEGDSYANNVNAVIPTQQQQQSMSEKVGFVNSQYRGAVANPGIAHGNGSNNSNNVHMEASLANGQYSARELQGAYPQLGNHLGDTRNNTTFSHERKNNNQNLGSWYNDGSMRVAHHQQRRNVTSNLRRDTFSLPVHSAPQLGGGTLHSLGSIPLPDQLNATGVGSSNDPATSQSGQQNALPNGLFGPPDNLDVEAPMYNVDATTQNVTQFSNAIGNFPNSTALPMTQVPFRGQGMFTTNASNRNA